MRLTDFLQRLRSLSPPGEGFKPHKALLLLATVDQLEQQAHPQNRIYFNDQLRQAFTQYFSRYSRDTDRDRPYTPFFHLSSSGFWHLKAKPGQESALVALSTVGGPGALTEVVDYAYLDDDVYELLQAPDSITRVRECLFAMLTEYSKPEEPSAIADEKGKYSIADRNRSLFVHEENAIARIVEGAKNTAAAISNVLLHDKQSNSYLEVDLVVVSWTQIWVVELKHWSGTIEVAPYTWVRNGSKRVADPHRNNSFKCKVLRGIYQHQFPTYSPLWVESVVVLTHPDIRAQGTSDPKIAAEQGTSNPTFACIDDFLSYLRRRANTAPRSALTDAQVMQVANFFRDLQRPKTGKGYHIPGYETVEYLFQSPERVDFIARPISGLEKGLRRIRVFRFPVGTPPEKRQSILNKIRNTVDAIRKMGDHPHIHRIWIHHNDEGDIEEYSDWSEVGTLRDLITQRSGAFPIDEALSICRGIAEALKHAHRVEVYHRAVKPENILMMNGIPKLTNFDLSFHCEEGTRHTVITDPGQLRDDAYISPDLLLDQDIDESTDFFSLGVIAYELLTGKKPFTSSRHFAAHGGRLQAEALQRLTECQVPPKTIAALREMIVSDRVQRSADVDAIIDAFSPDVPIGKPPLVPTVLNAELDPGSRYDNYEIVERIGRGAHTQVYRARGFLGREVALKLFDREVPLERIEREARIAGAVKLRESPYVVTCDGRPGRWHNDRFFLVMDFVDGELLRKRIERGERPTLDTFCTTALGLLEGVKAFHEHTDPDGNPMPYLHSDIKPDNIAITADDRPVLLDLGSAGEPRVDVFEGTIGYVPPDSILGTEMQFSESADLFALGVTLWEWLFGQRPYENPVVGDTPKLPESGTNAIPDPLLAWLRRAVATKAGDRFASAEEMRAALVSATTPPAVAPPPPEPEALVTPPLIAEPCHNPFTSYLNSLSSASAGNENATAESQVGNPLFDRVMVPHPLADLLYRKLVEERRSVILTGNAGDGKTTLASEVFRRVMGQLRSLRQREEIPRANLTIIKDMSELAEEQREATLLEAMRARDTTWLIVSNTGTLINSARRAAPKLKLPEDQIESELLTHLEADEPKLVLGERFLLINLGRFDSIDAACEVFARMLDAQNWEECNGCGCADGCPILANIRLLQEHAEVVRGRVALLYRRLYEYGVRLTMRQMTGHLAYAITGGRTCEELAKRSWIARAEADTGALFFNLFFGDDGDQPLPEAGQLVPIQRVREAEFGVTLDPLFERSAWMKGGDGLPLHGSAQAVFQRLRQPCQGDDGAEGYAGACGAPVRRQARRLVYFFGSLEDEKDRRYLSTFIQSPMLLESMRFAPGTDTMPRLVERRHRVRVLQVLQEFFTGIRLPEDQGMDHLYITLNRRDGNAATQVVLADFRAEEFRIEVLPRYQGVPHTGGIWRLRHESGVAMDLDLFFLDFVARRYEGEIAQELTAYYADRLERFKVGLLRTRQEAGPPDENQLRLLRIGPDRRFEVIEVAITDQGLEVLR